MTPLSIKFIKFIKLICARIYVAVLGYENGSKVRKEKTWYKMLWIDFLNLMCFRSVYLPATLVQREEISSFERSSCNAAP